MGFREQGTGNREQGKSGKSGEMGRWGDGDEEMGRIENFIADQTLIN
ncbi:hypothetical protein [Moorena sp. SIO3H5]|nr:hypothetical protein [Moorena sp. SIO3H5]NEO69935.1 hypothetical protein [Moorena sp. SIO3H5]